MNLGAAADLLMYDPVIFFSVHIVCSAMVHLEKKQSLVGKSGRRLRPRVKKLFLEKGGVWRSERIMR
jgi:hypothetical protein